MVGLVKMGHPGAIDIGTHFSIRHRNFMMHRVDIATGQKAVVIKSQGGVRKIVLLGKGTKVMPGFSGSAGMVTLSVKKGICEIHCKKLPVTNFDSGELGPIVRALDAIDVSVDDIIGLLDQMDKKGALNAKLYWADK